MAHPHARRSALRGGGRHHRGRRGDGQQARVQSFRWFRKASLGDHDPGAGLPAERHRAGARGNQGARDLLGQAQLDAAAGPQRHAGPDLLSGQLGACDVFAEAEAVFAEAQAVLAEAQAVVLVAVAVLVADHFAVRVAVGVALALVSAAHA